VDCVSVSPDGRWLASGSKDKSVRIWDLKTNALAESRNLADVRRGFAVSPKAEFLAVVNADATLSFWDLSARRETGRFPIETNATILATSPAGTAVVLAVVTGSSARVWMHRVDTTNSDIQVKGVLARKAIAAFSADGRQFAVGGREQILRLGMTDGSAPVRELKHPIDMTTDILFSQDGRQVFAANESGKVRVSDSVTGELVRDFAAHEHVVAGLALDTEGRLATSSADGTVGLWDVANPGVSRTIATGQTLECTKSAVAKPGPYVNTGTASGSIEIARTGIKSLKIRYNSVFGYYLEVTPREAQHSRPLATTATARTGKASRQ
jgi:DNA-binding beta-propeller fold protein YncE